jgi:hypothetical protein
MLKEFPEDFKRFFFLEFTRQLIENSTEKSIYELEHLIKDKEKEERKEIIEKFKTAQKKLREHEIKVEEEKKDIKKEVKKRIEFENKIKKYPSIKKKLKKRFLKIPSTRLPPHLQYLKPEPIEGIEIDIGRLNYLLKDPMIQEIQCDGADENILVKGTFGIKPTKIILKEEEINEIIEEFSNKSKIPIEPGIFKVVMGKIIFTAIISETTSSRFILTKMNYNSAFQY